jgi:hypothetical protein
MPTDMVTCTNCGKTFSVGVPRGKRIKNYDDAGFWTGPAIIFDIHFNIWLQNQFKKINLYILI